MQKSKTNSSVPDANNFKPVKIKFYDDGRQMTFSAKDFRDMAIGGAMRKILAYEIGSLRNEKYALTKEVTSLLEDLEDIDQSRLAEHTSELKTITIQLKVLEWIQKKALRQATDNYSKKVTTWGERKARQRKGKSK